MTIAITGAAGQLGRLAIAAPKARGAHYDDSRTLSRSIGRPMTPISETITVALQGD